ncbi:protein ERGIC-53-like [Symsagittifera roscoffensis]|uniref:protein ERGIC-53-like n=1 Tax=Symsagittifera roscoffensis TaxID=84072 RepID=UPI00307B5128
MWLFAVSALFLVATGDDLIRKFEYQYSFKGPQLTIDNQVPFWSHGESALPSEDQIRLVPSIRSKKGFVWSQFAYASKDFEVEVTFKITGRGRIGADGMAVWFTDSPGFEGNVYGNRDMWNGLGIFMDSYDNDGKGNNPYISIVANGGSKSYDHAADGGDMVLAGCQYDFRNKPYPVKLKFKYYKQEIKLWYSAGLTQEPEYELCLTHYYDKMPDSKFLGLSAATGGLADDHDVLSFLTYSLRPKEAKDSQKIADADKERLSEEFKKFSDTMEERKKNFREENPSKFKDIDDPDFEDVQERQLRLIFDGQHRLFRSLNEIKAKLDGSGKPGTGTSGSAVSSDQIRRLQTELGSIGSTINHVYTVANEQKTILREIQNRVVQIQTGRAPSPGQVPGATTGAGLDAVAKDDLTSIKQDLAGLKENVRKIPIECPKIPPRLSASASESDGNCIGNSTFIIFAVLQIVLMGIYVYFQRQKEQSAKKFF